MAFTLFSKDMDIVSKLSDSPNVDDGLTAAQLKEKFDEGGKAIKSYINDTLLQEVLEKPLFVGLVKSDGNGLVSAVPGTDYLEHIADGAVTLDKLGEDVTASALGGAALNSNGKVEAVQTSSRIKNIAASTYTILSTDAGQFLRFTYEGAVSVTLPYDEDVELFPVGTEIELNCGLQATTISMTTPDTTRTSFWTSNGPANIINSAPTVKYAVIVLKRVQNNRWLVKGDVE